ncbi:MAG: chloride channel protein [Actinomycetota bacterium]|nr:chloride channel protein [Actinomycetota bacterium]MED5233221.1 chloride channel protein [Actinomycetota bacterium]MEE3354237.1 chloride channel protein [Actinomycetota bacterium]
MRRLRSIATRGDTPVLALAILTGAMVAVLIAGFEYVSASLILERILHRPLWQIAIAPGIGLLLTALILRYPGRRLGTGTSDEFNKAFHDRTPSLPLRNLPIKLLAGITTIGMGGALGLEGPSIYAGSTIGLGVRDRFRRWLRREDVKILLTAGAAAGVAAVFKAPATGVLFALEAPYRDDVNRRALLPSLLASATSYVTYINLIGHDAVIPFLNDPENRIGLNVKQLAIKADTDVVWFDSADLATIFTAVEVSDVFGALLLGIFAGLGGRFMAWLVRWAKTQSKTPAFVPRVLMGGFALAGLAMVADLAFDAPLTIGPGFKAMEWVVRPGQGLGLIALLFGLRIAATIVTLAAGGVGGLFIPLAVQGVIIGQFTGTMLEADRPGLYPTLGLAAFLGAGYRAPISAVMFVAESTGGSFVVPALVAAAVSQLVAGKSSVAEHQHSVRLGHLERRFTLPVTSALDTDVLTVPPDATVAEFMYLHVLGRRERSVAVVDGIDYRGMISLSEVSAIERSAWDDTAVGDLLNADLPAARPNWSLRDAIVAMEQADVDILAVTDAEGAFIGMLSADDILKLDEILDETGG